jgi:NADH-quinone oxidoreductase subunit M
MSSFKVQKLDKSFYYFNNNELNQKNINVQLNNNNSHLPLFGVFVLILQFLLHILFITDNILIFFICFEGSVIPILCIIGFFGKRSLKFKAMNYILYFTLVSAVPFIIFVIFTKYYTGTFYYPVIANFFAMESQSVISFPLQIFFFSCCFVPFAVKLALFPFHT